MSCGGAMGTAIEAPIASPTDSAMRDPLPTRTSRAPRIVEKATASNPPGPPETNWNSLACVPWWDVATYARAGSLYDCVWNSLKRTTPPSLTPQQQLRLGKLLKIAEPSWGKGG
jgi:hypothetical protein